MIKFSLSFICNQSYQMNKYLTVVVSFRVSTNFVALITSTWNISLASFPGLLLRHIAASSLLWTKYNIYQRFCYVFPNSIRLWFTAVKNVTMSWSELTRSSPESRKSWKAGHSKARWFWFSTMVMLLESLPFKFTHDWQASVSFLYNEGKFPLAGNIFPASRNIMRAPSKSRLWKYPFLSYFSLD